MDTKVIGNMNSPKTFEPLAIKFEGKSNQVMQWMQDLRLVPTLSQVMASFWQLKSEELVVYV